MVCASRRITISIPDVAECSEGTSISWEGGSPTFDLFFINTDSGDEFHRSTDDFFIEWTPRWEAGVVVELDIEGEPGVGSSTFTIQQCIDTMDIPSNNPTSTSTSTSTTSTSTHFVPTPPLSIPTISTTTFTSHAPPVSTSTAPAQHTSDTSVQNSFTSIQSQTTSSTPTESLTSPLSTQEQSSGSLQTGSVDRGLDHTPTTASMSSAASPNTANTSSIEHSSLRLGVPISLACGIFAGIVFLSLLALYCRKRRRDARTLNCKPLIHRHLRVFLIRCCL